MICVAKACEGCGLVESDVDWACVDKETATILVKAIPVGGQIAKVGDHP